MGKRLVSFRRYHLHCFYLCLLIHTDFFSADRAAPLISPCLVANPFKIQHKPCKIWICTYPRSGPRHCEDSLGVCLEKKKTNCEEYRCGSSPQTHNSWKHLKGEDFGANLKLTGIPVKWVVEPPNRSVDWKIKKPKHLILLNCNEEAKLDHCFKN